MMKLDEILESWSKDSEFDETNIASEILNIPKLHSKYLSILKSHRFAALKAKFEYDRIKNIKAEYYLGHLDKESLDEYGWEPFDLKLTKGGAERYLSSDADLIKLVQKKEYHEQSVNICEQILNEIKNRTWQTRVYVDYQRMMAGS